MKKIKTTIKINKQASTMAGGFLGLVISSSICVPIIVTETNKAIEFKVAWNNVYSLRNNLYSSYRKQLISLNLDSNTINERVDTLTQTVDTNIADYKQKQVDPLKAYTYISDLGNELGLELIDWELVTLYKTNLMNNAIASISHTELTNEQKDTCIKNLENDFDQRLAYCKQNEFSLEETIKYLTSSGKEMISSFNKEQEILITTMKIEQLSSSQELKLAENSIFFDQLLNKTGFEIGKDVVNLLSDVLTYKDKPISSDSIENYVLKATLNNIDYKIQKIDISYSLIYKNSIGLPDEQSREIKATNSNTYELKLSPQAELGINKILFYKHIFSFRSDAYFDVLTDIWKVGDILTMDQLTKYLWLDESKKITIDNFDNRYLSAEVVVNDHNTNEIGLSFLIQDYKSLKFDDASQRIFKTVPITFKLNISPDLRNKTLEFYNDMATFLATYNSESLAKTEEYRDYTITYKNAELGVAITSTALAVGYWAAAWWFGITIPLAIAATASAGLAWTGYCLAEAQANEITNKASYIKSMMNTPEYKKIVSIDVDIREIIKYPLGVIIMDVALYELTNILSKLISIPSLTNIFNIIKISNIANSIKDFLHTIKALSISKKVLGFLNILGTVLTLTDIGVNIWFVVIQCIYG
ncbi:MAG: hypothetical protein LBF00_04290 [Mycoplasmataceae bacterium]|nr:hypothetical protein [Mycoplasmataceae bacterium]